MATSDNELEFAHVTSGGSGDRKVWFLIIPAVLGLGALLVFAGLAISKTSGLESQVKLAEQQAAESNKAVEERDKLLLQARADEAVLKSAGQGAAVLAAPDPKSPASGVAIVHPDANAVLLHVFGLSAPPQGQAYRVEAVKGGERKSLGVLRTDGRGAAFLLAKELPEGATGVEVVLGGAQAAAPATQGDAAGTAQAGAAAPAEGEAQRAAAEGDAAKADEATAPKPEGTLILAGTFPPEGTAGVMRAPEASELQARTPQKGARRRPTPEPEPAPAPEAAPVP